MNTNSSIEPPVGQNGILDVRELPCEIKHGLLLRTCQALPVGSSFVLWNGHFPRGVLEQLEVEWPETFAWKEVTSPAGGFQVRITKLIVATEKSSWPAPPACKH